MGYLSTIQLRTLKYVLVSSFPSPRLHSSGLALNIQRIIHRIYIVKQVPVCFALDLDLDLVGLGSSRTSSTYGDAERPSAVLIRH